MRYLRCTNIDAKRFGADSDEQAIEKFKELIKYEVQGGQGSPIKDYYLCKIIAIHGNWNEFPRGFSILSKEGREDMLMDTIHSSASRVIE